MDDSKDNPPRPIEYDFIIIGAGSAGSLLTSRLVTSPKFERRSILVLEAGKERDGDPKIDTPAHSGQLLGNADYDWAFVSESEAGLDGRQVKHPRGRVVGGTSAINSHSVVFPSRYYHDFWDKNLLSGSASEDEKHERVDWSWKGMQDYYSRPFEVHPPSEEARDKLRISKNAALSSDQSTEARLDKVQTSFPITVFPLQKYWTDTFAAANFLSSSFGMDGRAFGGFTALNAVDSRPMVGARSHTGHFWRTLKTLPNVSLLQDVMVNTIIFAENTSSGTRQLRASGVQFSRFGQTEEVLIKEGGEVILSAGVFGSPQILELSGIGAKNVLSSAGLPCLRDLPGVGENLQDHLNCGCSVEITDDTESRDAEWQDPILTKQISDLYAAEKTGPLANGWAYSYSHLPSQWLSEQEEQIQLQEAVAKATGLSGAMSEGIKIQHQFIKSAVENPNEATATMLMIPQQRNPDLDRLPVNEPRRVAGKFVTVFSQLSYPFSRGSCHVTSIDPAIRPQLNFNYLSNPLDRRLFCTHLRQIERFLDLPPISQIVKPGGRRLPRTNAGKFTELDDERLDEVMKATVATNYHPCGTCAMMAESLGGVVDDKLKVYGTWNVRVVDASIFAIIPRGNILTTVYAVAEKAADIILSEVHP